MNPKSNLLADVAVVHLGTGMAPALVTKFLVELGATATRVEPPEGDPFGAVYPAYDVWLRGAPRDAEARHSPERLAMLLAEADLCVIGGEDYPGVTRRHDPAALAAQYPRLVVLDLEAAPAASEFAGRPAAEVLVQARSGLVHEQYLDRPVLMAFAPANYGAAMRGLAGVLAALYEREASGRGQVVATSLLEGAMTWACGGWCEVEKPTPYTEFAVPKSPVPLIFRCADGKFIHLVIGAHGSKYRMYQALEIDDPSVGPDDSGIPKPTADVRNFYGDIDVLAAHVAKKTSAELLARIWERGLPAEPVWPPGRCWDEPQVRHNGVIVADADGTRHVGNPLRVETSPARGRASPKSGARPLEGVRVVDFGAFVAGPFASAVLADLGADVVKVETLAGDPHRTVFRFYTSVNRGKRSIAIDLKTPEGRRVAHELCAGADVVMSNFRPGVTARLGLDVDSLRALNPHIVVLESPAYGADGPLAERAGFDMVMQAYCGHEWRAGGEGREPMWNRTSMVDFAAGFLGAAGILAALYHRARTGDSAFVVSPLVNAGISLLAELVQRGDGRFEGAPPLNRWQTGFHPAEALYRAADGWIAIAVRGREAAVGFAGALGLTGWLDEDPARWRDAEVDAIAAAVARLSIGDALARLDAAGVWAERCRQDMAREVLHDPALHAANVVQISTHPTFGEVRELGPMLRFSRSQAGHRRHAPLIGEASAEVLAELGRSPQDIAALVELEVVRARTQ
ncbi:MAG: CoA transferase [Aromatoleum sp.]|jgi:crotonobetainyl-CoA:carnitine CoA-transferase CaiB-like acyl-CoA transferase|uniref:CoA transferase n=1 Tax=Aromatoleum sp. TaxID=2307007 RepID=UPI002893AE9E|nr:CoA transferase [Aromatoleum sp.]MDT3670205.1 CoA transferase [Aromatoleum sp.]